MTLYNHFYLLFTKNKTPIFVKAMVISLDLYLQCGLNYLTFYSLYQYATYIPLNKVRLVKSNLQLSWLQKSEHLILW